MADSAQPRANAAMLPALEGRGVTLLGQVAEAGAAGAAFVVTAADRKPVSVSMNAGTQADAPLAAGHWVDVTGVVQHGKVVAVRERAGRRGARAPARPRQRTARARPKRARRARARRHRPGAEANDRSGGSALSRVRARARASVRACAKRSAITNRSARGAGHERRKRASRAPRRCICARIRSSRRAAMRARIEPYMSRPPPRGSTRAAAPPSADHSPAVSAAPAQSTINHLPSPIDLDLYNQRVVRARHLPLVAIRAVRTRCPNRDSLAWASAPAALPRAPQGDHLLAGLPARLLRVKGGAWRARAADFNCTNAFPLAPSSRRCPAAYLPDMRRCHLALPQARELAGQQHERGAAARVEHRARAGPQLEAARCA